jgi:hypothetical protein
MRTIANCQEVAEAIDADLVDQPLDLFPHRSANSLLAPGNTGRRHQFLKQSRVHSIPSHRSFGRIP